MANHDPKPLLHALEQLAGVKAVFFDIDDTFSGSGAPAHDWRIQPRAYEALWNLRKAGIHVVPVTGRPAGWCDLITRMWPVSAVVGENGAFYSYMDSSRTPPKLVKRYLEDAKTRAANAKKLKGLHQHILKRFPQAKVPSDQPFREFDLAIDYCEDVRRWKDAHVEELLELCRNRGAQAKLSSIHVNTWFGRYDKWSCVRRVLKNFLDIDPQRDILNVAYIGDSPNDEPFFRNVPLSIGVANVRKFLTKMEFGPAFITDAESGEGFAEFASILLRARSTR